MKIKLIACFAFVAILSSCSKQDEILPKSVTDVSTLRPTNFNNSWPLAKTVKPVKSLIDSGNENLSDDGSSLISNKLIAQDHNR